MKLPDSLSYDAECSEQVAYLVSKPARHSEKSQILSTLTTAFISDPPARWIYSDADTYLRSFPRFAQAFGGEAFNSGTAWCCEGFSACALWIPPGTEPEEQAIFSVVEDSVPQHRQAEVFAVFEALSRVHPTEPHWYLPLLGVDAASQGHGLGGVLLRQTLSLCDKDRLPAYLEASNPRNVPFYERYGFRRLEPLRAGNCPPITPMWREAVA